MSFLDQIYEVSRGAVVEIHIKEGTIRGEFNLDLQGEEWNPEVDQIRLEHSIELPSGKELNGSVSILVNDIINFTVLEVGEGEGQHQSGISTASISQRDLTNYSRVNEKMEQPVELMLRTCVINDEESLEFLIKFLKEINVCGVSFEGENLGPNGEVAWIVLATEKVVIPIDVVLLSGYIEHFWQVLGKSLFGNAKIVKVMHDAQPAADFVFYKHGIEFVNIFDIQVADVVIFQAGTKSVPIQLNTLSECLRVHNNCRIPDKELEFLKMYESYDYTTNSPMLIRPRPPPAFLKFCALKVKYLIHLRQNMMMKMIQKMAFFCTEAHMESCRKKNNSAFASIFKDTRSVSPELLPALEDNISQSHQTI